MIELIQNDSISLQARQLFKRRFVVMIKQWISVLEKNKNELLNLLLKQLDSASDLAVLFTIIECLNLLIKSDYTCEMNYEVILKASVVTIVRLLTEMTNPNFVWQISHFVGNLLNNCADQISLNILNTLNNLEIENIIQRNPELMMSVFAEIFKNILVSSPNPSFLFIASLRYLTICSQIMESDNVEMLSLIHI